MIGARLAVKVHIVTSPVTARQNAINAVNRAGLVVADMVLEQLAAAEASLTEDDKEFGAALVDVGAETTGINYLSARSSSAHCGVSSWWFAFHKRHRLWFAHADTRSGENQADCWLCVQ